MPRSPAAGRRPLGWVARIAVAVLVADALVLGAVGLRARRPLFVLIAVLSLAAGWVVLRLERRYRRQLEEIQAARRELGADLRAMAGELRRQAPDQPSSGP